ncbi:hypothetical protein [Mariniflexile sp.]|uniref:hypothetical protein n=1 Tax=Mariniflexile sp. TaxID=1979402 RepID=UPI003566E398
MNDKKHIDRLFQERFKDFEATPSDTVWQNIESELTKKKKKRRIIPIWWQYAGVAAMLALLFTIGGSYFYNSDKNPTINVVDTEREQTRSSNIKTAIETNKDNNTKVVSNDGESSKIIRKSDASKLINLKSGTASNKKTNINNNFKNSNNHVAASVGKYKTTTNSEIVTSNVNKTVQNNESLIALEHAKKEIIDASKEKTTGTKIEEKNKNNVSIEEAVENAKRNASKKNGKNKWRISPNAAPVYFSSLGEGSSIDPQFNNNSKTGEVNMSYGIHASYAVNHKLKVRSGINKVNLGYSTNDVAVYHTVGASSSTRVLENVIAVASDAPDNLSIISSESINVKPEAFTTTNSSINQAFAYIEIPLEIQYAIVNNKFGINLIGGFSSFFLSDNKIYSEAETGTRTFLGEASNINNVSYSANLGLGLNYQVSKKIDLNIEPMFKYQINTFNNTSGDFSPYFIGVYTGFAIKF